MWSPRLPRFRVQGLGFMVQVEDFGCKVQVKGLGFRFRVLGQGLGKTPTSPGTGT